MNRRSFFGYVSGLIGGVCGAFVPSKPKSQSSVKSDIRPYEGYIWSVWSDDSYSYGSGGCKWTSYSNGFKE